MLVKIYVNGEIVWVDDKDLYDPFPKKEEEPREKNVSYNERIEGEQSPSKALRLMRS